MEQKDKQVFQGALRCLMRTQIVRTNVIRKGFVQEKQFDNRDIAYLIALCSSAISLRREGLFLTTQSLTEAN